MDELKPLTRGDIVTVTGLPKAVHPFQTSLRLGRIRLGRRSELALRRKKFGVQRVDVNRRDIQSG